MKKSLLITFGILTILILATYLFLLPQLRVLTGYVAKNVCSCTFIAEREAEQIRAQDVGYGLLKYANFEIDEEQQKVSSSALGIVKRTAVYRGDLGCVLLPKKVIVKPMTADLNLPETKRVDNFPKQLIADSASFEVDQFILNAALDKAFESKGTRAILVLADDYLVAERYAEGFDKEDVHLGWSMTKSLTNAMIGILVKQGKLNLEDAIALDNWQTDERKNITLNHLLQMNSGLDWEEVYDKASSATLMLFEAESMGKSAAEVPQATLPNRTWRYSSGTTNILSEVVRQQFDETTTYWEFPYRELFDKINAPSFRIEADYNGTFVGSSYSFATARDWARFGSLYLHDGYWNGKQLFPDYWVKYTTTEAPNSKGNYGAHFWLNRGGEFPAAPADMYYCAGFDGQYVFVIPSQRMVIVRLGVDGVEEMDENAFFGEVLKAVRLRTLVPN
jgi:CubicO group peptidase (beta-lactamase class C family)